MKSLIIGVLRAYKRLVSPMLPHACRFVPTCSDYAIQAVEEHGAVRGAALAFWRVVRCNPFGRAGLDPVPSSRGRAPLQSKIFPDKTFQSSSSDIADAPLLRAYPTSK